MTRYARGFKGSMSPAAGPRVGHITPLTPKVMPKGMPSPAEMEARKARGEGMIPKTGLGGLPIGQNPTRVVSQGIHSIPKTMKKGGSVGSASKRADGIATKGKTKGKIC